MQWCTAGGEAQGLHKWPNASRPNRSLFNPLHLERKGRTLDKIIKTLCTASVNQGERTGQTLAAQRRLVNRYFGMHCA